MNKLVKSKKPIIKLNAIFNFFPFKIIFLQINRFSLLRVTGKPHVVYFTQFLHYHRKHNTLTPYWHPENNLIN